jgi:phage tail-like protein
MRPKEYFYEYPMLGYYFKVAITGFSGSDFECNFQEVSGISVKLGLEQVVEGGLNNLVHKLPTHPTYENLVLKRGMFLYNNSQPGLLKWVHDTLTNFTFSPRAADIMLLDENAEPLASWNFQRVFPVALKVSDFNATQGAVQIETMELSYDYFTRTK